MGSTYRIYSWSSNWCICSETGIQPWKSTGNNKSKWSSTSGHRCWNSDSCNMHITFESKCGWSGKFTRTNHYVSCRRLIFGAMAQKSRMCFAGGIRDVIIMKNFDLLSVIGGLFVVMLIFNIATGKFVVGFNTPGVIAHSEHLWNILGMYTVGFAAVLAGGCPLRQLILAGQGSSDSGVTVIGMFVGSAICHNFGLAASGTALNPETKAVVAGAVPTNGKVACILCIVVLFIIAFTCKRETAKK